MKTGSRRQCGCALQARHGTENQRHVQIEIPNCTQVILSRRAAQASRQPSALQSLAARAVDRMQLCMTRE